MCNLHKFKHLRTYMAHTTLVSHRQVRVTDVLLRCNRTSFTKHISIYCKKNNLYSFTTCCESQNIRCFDIKFTWNNRWLFSVRHYYENEAMFKEHNVADNADQVTFNGTRTIQPTLNTQHDQKHANITQRISSKHAFLYLNIENIFQYVKQFIHLLLNLHTQYNKVSFVNKNIILY